SNASLTVNAESEGTSISISPTTTSTTYGSETGITYTGTVTGQSNDGYPEGTVTVKTSGGTDLCSVITLGTGTSDTNTYSCPISSNTLLTASTYTVTATYTPGAGSSSNGDFSYSGSTSSNASLTVIKSPTYVGVGTAQTWTSAGTETVAYPSSLASGDLLLLMIANSQGSTMSCPSGWSAAGTVSTTNGDNAGFESCYLIWSTGSSVSVTTTTAGWVAEIAAFSDVGSTPLDGVTPVTTISGTDTSTFTPSGITTNSNGDLALSLAMQDDGSEFSVPTLNFTGTGGSAQGFTAVASTTVSDSSFSGWDDAAEAFAYQQIATAGGVTYPTWTTNHTAFNGSIWLGLSIALQPAS
ncbi:MAG TPA: hypothetical protein VN886_08020, partial [Acidimicrobiales bacterium]|nr:hypothetical protein [Acidimicrobiales bacterium]